MNFGIKSKQQLKGVGQFLLDEFDNVTSVVKGYWDQDHADDGTHKQVRERGRETPMGEWIQVPVVSSLFHPGGGLTFTAVTGDVFYTLIGLTIIFRYHIVGTLGGVLNSNFVNMDLPLNVSVPLLDPARTSQMSQENKCRETNAGTQYIGSCGILGQNPGFSVSQLQFVHEKGAIFPGAGTTVFSGELTAQITKIFNQQVT